MSASPLAKRVRAHLASLYPTYDADGLTQRVINAIGITEERDRPASAGERWTAADAVLIAYGDSVIDGARWPLEVLTDVVTRVGDALPVTHVLPFTPYSSDRGFAVVDYAAVDPKLGSWADIDALDGLTDLMVDLVCNHVSAESAWFTQFLTGDDPGRNYFVTIEPGHDLTGVVRPRAGPAAQSFSTSVGDQELWCTFGRDQIDLDYSNPDVLIEMLRVIDLYISHGARFLRLDAIAYLWKQPGTPSIHLPETHEIVRLWRTLLAARSPQVALVSETNVPDSENRTYFGAGDEAHIVYNFTLPPLVVDALLQQSAERLGAWLAASAPPPAGCTYINFVSSHDGLGLRPAEGILDEAAIDDLVAAAQSRGGLSRSYATPGGTRPYELNISLWDLLSGTSGSEPDGMVELRFLAAHAIVLSLAGIPAIYINNLFADGSDREGADQSGVARDITRARLSFELVTQRLGVDDSPRSRSTRALLDLLKVRSRQPAFHPDSRQSVSGNAGPVLVVHRRAGDDGQRIIAVYNLSPRDEAVDVDHLGADPDHMWVDLVSGDRVEVGRGLVLSPYQAVWLTYDSR
jgi:sucrose phosphorylase